MNQNEEARTRDGEKRVKMGLAEPLRGRLTKAAVRSTTSSCAHFGESLHLC